MKRLCLLFATIVMTVSAGADRLLAPKVDIQGDLSKYNYVYIIPTSGVTSNSGVHGSIYGGAYGTYGGVHGGTTKTVNPSEEISGQLIKRGYTVLPSIDPALAEETMVVSYGNTGRRTISAFAYASCIVLQFTDAATHKKVVTLDSEGCGIDETEDIHQAINRAFAVFDYCRSPLVKLEIIDATRASIYLWLHNYTPHEIKSYTLKILYYQDEEIVYEQFYTTNTSIDPGESERVYIKRDKQARSNKYTIKAKIVGIN